jgi:hypothetical protein
MKAYFMTRNLREKLLVLAMLLVGLVIWSSLFMERTGELMTERRRVNLLRAELGVYIDNRDLIR